MSLTERIATTTAVRRFNLLTRAARKWTSKAIRFIACAAPVALTLTHARGDDNAALVAFARANADKFRHEIVTGPVKLGDRLTVRGRFDKLEMSGPKLPEYSPELGGVRFTELSVMSSLLLSERCKPGSSYMGQNAFGVKMRVQRQGCERIFASDVNVMGPPIRYTALLMSAEQYREIKRAGVGVEFDLAIGEGVKSSSSPVTYFEGGVPATLDHPYDTVTHVWTVVGRIDAIRWFLPGNSQPTLVWRREPAAEKVEAPQIVPSLTPASPPVAAQNGQRQLQPNDAVVANPPAVATVVRLESPVVDGAVAAQPAYLKMVPSLAPHINRTVWIESVERPSQKDRPSAAVIGLACKGSGKFAVAVGTEITLKKTWSIAPPLTDVRYFVDNDETHRNWERFGPSEAGPLSGFGGLGGFIDDIVLGKVLRIAFERDGADERQSYTFNLDATDLRSKLTALRKDCR